MARFARTCRIGKDTTSEDVFIDSTKVLYVCQEGQGSYIAFREEWRDEGRVIPVGIRSPDPAHVVRKQLEAPYRREQCLKWVGVGLTAVAIVVAVAALEVDWPQLFEAVFAQ